MTGALDFSQSDRFSALWRLKREIVFEQLEADNLIRLKTLRHLQHATAASYTDNARYDHHFSEASTELALISESLFPWVKWQKKSKSEEYQKIWEDFFGIKVGSEEWNAIERKGELMLKMQKEKQR